MNKFYIRILGATYEADFIIIVLAIIGLITIINHLIKTHRKSNWLEEAQEKQQRQVVYMNKATQKNQKKIIERVRDEMIQFNKPFKQNSKTT